MTFTMRVSMSRSGVNSDGRRSISSKLCVTSLACHLFYNFLHIESLQCQIYHSNLMPQESFAIHNDKCDVHKPKGNDKLKSGTCEPVQIFR